MNELKVYAPRKLRITRGVSLPAAWHEVPAEKLPDLALLRLFREQLALRVSAAKQFIPARVQRKLCSYQVVDIAGLFSWVWSPITTARPFPYFTHEGVDYHLPTDSLTFIVAIEYAFVDYAFIHYQKAREAGDEEKARNWLNKFVVYFCRPIDPRIDPNDASTFKGDQREMFNTAICERRIDSISRLPASIKVMLLQYFSACKEKIHKLYKGSIFMDKEVNGVEISGVREMRPHEWIEMCYALAGGKFGDLQSTMYTHLTLILHELSRKK